MTGTEPKQGAAALITGGGVGGLAYAFVQLFPAGLQTVGEALAPALAAGWAIIWPWLASTGTVYFTDWNNDRKVKRNDKKVDRLRRMADQDLSAEAKETIKGLIDAIQVENVNLIAS